MYIFDFEKCHLLYNMVKTMYSISQVAVWGCSIYMRIVIIMGNLDKVFFLFHCSHILLKLRAIYFVFRKGKESHRQENGRHRKS